MKFANDILKVDMYLLYPSAITNQWTNLFNLFQKTIVLLLNNFSLKKKITNF
jgi:hypothetical protein